MHDITDFELNWTFNAISSQLGQICNAAFVIQNIIILILIY